MDILLKACGLDLTSLIDLIPSLCSIDERKIHEEDLRCKLDSDVDHRSGLKNNGIFHTGHVNHTLNSVFNFVRKGAPKQLQFFIVVIGTANAGYLLL